SASWPRKARACAARSSRVSFAEDGVAGVSVMMVKFRDGCIAPVPGAPIIAIRQFGVLRQMVVLVLNHLAKTTYRHRASLVPMPCLRGLAKAAAARRAGRPAQATDHPRPETLWAMSSLFAGR